jgi:hypothetical protein
MLLLISINAYKLFNAKSSCLKALESALALLVSV